MCSLTTTQSATRITVSVNAIFEYQWKANLTLPAAGKYCYRVYLGAVDLLGAEPFAAVHHAGAARFDRAVLVRGVR